MQCKENVNIIKSANQQVYEYYHDISAAELKAYALIQLAYMIFTIYGRGMIAASWGFFSFFFSFLISTLFIEF